MMPLGKAHELQGFRKEKLLEHLDLPTDEHLLLACIITFNDHVQNIPYFDLLINCEIVWNIDLSELPPLGSLENDDRAKVMMPYVQKYLRAVHNRLETRPRRATQLFFHKAHQQLPRQSKNEDHTNCTQRPSPEGASGFDPSPTSGMDLDTDININAGSVASSTSTQHDCKKSTPSAPGTPKRK
ncbi:hypothetical protein BGZ95_000668 [Linnemannia exigua]|uniref:Uncharacterized protein n=1 Tax=Linnemannia exigua TaxID=604196 RepID=A0AAD4D891_9FUNG|nr:hypothetical protein BGZ95_000668 [Linnemannia exigua]